MKIILYTLFILILPVNLAAQDLTITFISNEGFLFESGDDKVLIDALHNQSHPDHTYPSDKTISEMVNGSGLFSNIDVYLQSHVHNTHFRPTIVGSFLKQNSHALMVASPQVRDSLQQQYDDYDSIKDRLTVYNWTKASTSYTLNGVHVEAFKITHIGQNWSWVKNLGHIISVGSKKVLHMGDLEWDEQTLLNMRLNTSNISVAILPHWIITSPQRVERIKEVINADTYIISHITIANRTAIEQMIQNRFPNALILNEPLKQHILR